jgi:glutaredoxin
MLTLYIRPGCHYCAEVLHAAASLGIAFDLKTVENPEVASELEDRGGKLQVPYLVDAENGVEMYESEDIIAHLHATFTPKA